VFLWHDVHHPLLPSTLRLVSNVASLFAVHIAIQSAKVCSLHSLAGFHAQGQCERVCVLFLCFVLSSVVSSDSSMLTNMLWLLIVVAIVLSIVVCCFLFFIVVLCTSTFVIRPSDSHKLSCVSSLTITRCSIRCCCLFKSFVLV
jgi:hypothetical protein